MWNLWHRLGSRMSYDSTRHCCSELPCHVFKIFYFYLASLEVCSQDSFMNCCLGSCVTILCVGWCWLCKFRQPVQACSVSTNRKSWVLCCCTVNPPLPISASMSHPAHPIPVCVWPSTCPIPLEC